MTVWLQSGTPIVNASGVPIDCPHCPCGGGPPVDNGVCSSCCTGPVPSDITFTMTSDCTCLNGATFTVVWVPASSWWYVDTTICGLDFNATLTCSSGTWNLVVNIGGVALYNFNATASDCSGFSLTFPTESGSADIGPCGEAFSYNVGFTATGTVPSTSTCTSCCTNGLPNTLTAQIVLKFGGVMCDEATFDLTYNESDLDWEGFTTVGGQTYTLALVCDSDICSYGATCGSIEITLGSDCPSPCDMETICGGGAGVTCSCSPFSISFSRGIGSGAGCGCGHPACNSVTIDVAITA